MNRLRVGFIVESGHANACDVELIQDVSADTSAFLRPVLISLKTDGRPKSPPGRGLGNSGRRRLLERLRRAFGGLVRRIELWRLRKHRSHWKYRESVDLASLGLETVEFTAPGRCDGAAGQWPDGDDVARLRPCSIDVLVNCSAVELKRDIRDVCRFGVLSVHYGDDRVTHGGPAGFWEVFHRQPSTGFAIRQSAGAQADDTTLVRGSIMTAAFWMLNEADLRAKSRIFLLQSLRKLAKDAGPAMGAEQALGATPLTGANPIPRVGQVLSYCVREYSRMFGARVLEACGFSNRWSVSFMPTRTLDFPMSRAITVPNPPGHFLADPFVIEIAGRTLCFVEDFFYSDGRGRISAYEIHGQTADRIGVVLEDDTHLSFPFVFESDGDVYMIPESADRYQVRLYKAVEFPTRWRLEKILLDDVDAVDSCVMRWHDGRWYLFTNICSARMQAHHSELHIFHSDSLLDGEWQPIAGNPIVFDAQRARNGGLFRMGDKVFRVNQVHGMNHYGRAMQINEIVTLSPTSFAERVVSEVSPDFFPRLNSTHHLHCNGRYAVFDHCRLELRGAAARPS